MLSPRKCHERSIIHARSWSRTLKNNVTSCQCGLSLSYSVCCYCYYHYCFHWYRHWKFEILNMLKRYNLLKIFWLRASNTIQSLRERFPTETEFDLLNSTAPVPFRSTSYTDLTPIQIYISVRNNSKTQKAKTFHLNLVHLCNVCFRGTYYCCFLFVALSLLHYFWNTIVCVCVCVCLCVCVCVCVSLYVSVGMNMLVWLLFICTFKPFVLFLK